MDEQGKQERSHARIRQQPLTEPIDIRETACGKGAFISIVIPVYNEQEVLEVFFRRLASVFSGIREQAEFIFVNDGSTDRTVQILQRLRTEDQRVTIVDLSRNFGKEIAMTAGLDTAGGEAVIIIDADLQDPPELIPDLMRHWRRGNDVVYARRTAREGESLFKKTTARSFYRLMQKVGRVGLPEDAGDFRLLSRRAVAALGKLREQHRFMKGLFAWIGFHQQEVLYRREPRFAGKTKWSYWKLWNLAIEGITSFTITPLKIATYLGFIAALSAFAFGMYILADTLIFGNAVPGYPSLMVVILFLGGIQLITLGVIGEYLGRIFNESKRRPLYFIKGFYPSAASERRSHLRKESPSR